MKEVIKLVELIDARIDAGYETQQQFADAIDITRSYVNKLENCRVDCKPKHTTIRKMSEVLNVNEEEIKSWFSENKFKKGVRTVYVDIKEVKKQFKQED